MWARLRANRQANSPVLLDAGIRPELSGKVVCPACGAEETALFWSITRRKGQTLHLLCPVCERARVRYSLARNRAVDPVYMRAPVAGGMGMVAMLVVVGGLFYFRDAPIVQLLFEDLEAMRGALASGVSGAAGGVGSPSDPFVLPPSPAARGSTSPPRAAVGRAPGGGGGGSPPATRSGGGGISLPSLPRVPSDRGAATVAPPPAETPRPTVSDRPARLTFVARGDRRDDIDLYTAQVIERAGMDEARLLLEVTYDPQLNRTTVAVDTAARAWPRRLSWLRGWRRAP